MKSVIYITATNPRVYYCDTILTADSKRPDTQLGDMTFQETSNIPHLSSNDTTMVSFTEENIVIRTHLLMNQWYAFVRIVILQLELPDFRLTLLL